jgi:hypothetical protein
MGLIFFTIVVLQVLHSLRISTHNPMMLDERYAPFIQGAGFLLLARLITGGLPLMDSAAFTTLVDRWRLETHTFHLPCGETAVTLQDVSIILGLSINGTLVCGLVSPGGWRDYVGAAIGI